MFLTPSFDVSQNVLDDHKQTAERTVAEEAEEGDETTTGEGTTVATRTAAAATATTTTAVAEGTTIVVAVEIVEVVVEGTATGRIVLTRMTMQGGRSQGG